MELKNAANYVVDMVTFVAVVSPSYLQSMFLPAHMKETTLCCFYRFIYLEYTTPVSKYTTLLSFFRCPFLSDPFQMFKCIRYYFTNMPLIVLHLLLCSVINIRMQTLTDSLSRRINLLKQYKLSNKFNTTTTFLNFRNLLMGIL